jgi:hypothetical protein
MSYQENRKNIQSGDLIAWRGKGFFKMLLRIITGSPYGHVGITFLAGNRVYVLEAFQNKGVQITPLSNKLPGDHFPLKTQWNLATETVAMEEVGRKYSWLDTFRALLGRKTKSGNGWQCAEYAAAVLNKGGITVTANLPGHLVREVTPHLREGQNITKLLK